MTIPNYTPNSCVAAHSENSPVQGSSTCSFSLSYIYPLRENTYFLGKNSPFLAQFQLLNEGKMSRSCFAPSRGSSQGSPVDGCPYLVISVHHPSISAVCGHTTSHHHGGSWGHSCSWELGQGWHVHGATRIGCLGAGCPQGGLLILLVAPGPSRPVPWGLASMRAEAEAVKAGRSLKD